MMASVTIQPALDALPIELLYRLLDLLDAETILFSLGQVCRRFRQVAQNYRQYELNFQSVTQRSFRLMCRLIEPEQVISLTLSDDNRTPEQIVSFLARFQLQQFTRLRSLTLMHVDERHFRTILQTCPMVSSLSWSLFNNSLNDSDILPLIHGIVGRSNLQHLNLSLPWDQMDSLLWPDPCFLQSLTVSNRLEFAQFATILACSSHLKTFALQDCLIDDVIALSSHSTSYPQLTSLTFDDCTLDMNQCEWLLPLTPSLEQLHIVGGTDLNDGLRWEQLIQNRLKKLNKFEFAFSGDVDPLPDDAVNADTLIVSHRSAFWLKIKQWFVVCYYFKDSYTYSLYSLPICQCNVRFYPKKDKIFSSTYPRIHTDVIMTDRIHEMQLNLISLMKARSDSDEVGASFNVRRVLPSNASFVFRSLGCSVNVSLLSANAQTVPLCQQ